MSELQQGDYRMNEFTKQELKIIQWEINTAVNKLDMETLPSEKHSALNEKLKSMIDNYCDHDWVNGTYCTKCNKSPTGASIYCTCAGKWTCDYCAFK